MLASLRSGSGLTGMPILHGAWTDSKSSQSSSAMRDAPRVESGRGCSHWSRGAVVAGAGQLLASCTGEIMGGEAAQGLLDLAGDSIGLAQGLGTGFVVVGAGAYGLHAARQLTEGMSPGKLRTALRVSLACVPPAIMLAKAWSSTTPVGVVICLGESLALIVAANGRDLINALGRDAVASNKAVDRDGKHLPKPREVAERGLASALAPVPVNTAVTAIGDQALGAGLRYVAGDMGQALGNASVKGLYAVVNEGGSAYAGPLKCEDGRWFKAIWRNLRHPGDTFAHFARHTSMRISLAAITTELPRAISNALPPESRWRKVVNGVSWLTRALGEARGPLVKRYEALVEQRAGDADASDSADAAPGAGQPDGSDVSLRGLDSSDRKGTGTQVVVPLTLGGDLESVSGDSAPSAQPTPTGADPGGEVTSTEFLTNPPDPATA